MLPAVVRTGGDLRHDLAFWARNGFSSVNTDRNTGPAVRPGESLEISVGRCVECENMRNFSVFSPIPPVVRPLPEARTEKSARIRRPEAAAAMRRATVLRNGAERDAEPGDPASPGTRRSRRDRSDHMREHTHPGEGK